ncbi:prolyl-tRNA synthetase [Planoprotostelium fungivorum]|uniref:proline--tRNA ligase n=1 Tax=Planoprotostelium fungivorum TaxID=1890364 RepID=A0A2P6NWI1_9EUKA|nr:prolyl-tRNA synthetase [Planoprotostelium fungivorum]
MADNKEKQKKAVGNEKMLAQKETNFADWYTQTIVRSEMIDYYDISGCYILRPWSYSIWEQIQKYIDTRIKKLGVENYYFPLFVSQKALQQEKDHIEGFAPEVAWVTKSGSSDLVQPIAIRPTSETIMYPLFAKWIRSHRDLPYKVNQWVNVVRWEFKQPTPFLRSREFLWQEGHTAFATLEEAAKEVEDILNLYASVYEDLLAVPVVKGRKTENEKFPGGYYTTTVEAFVPASGKGIQGATSHCLGQNFAQMFNINFENEKKEKAMVWQNSWGLTTRTIGVMIMVHGDDRGLVLPPRVAPIQAVLVPIPYKDKDNEGLFKRAQELADQLEAAGVRIHFDDREGYTPGNKYNHWELKGVPLRIDFGPKDFEENNVVFVRRVDKSKTVVAQADIVSQVQSALEDIQKTMLEKARRERDSHIKNITEWKQLVPELDNRNIVMAPWCQDKECEEQIKKRSTIEAAAAATASKKKKRGGRGKKEEEKKEGEKKEGEGEKKEEEKKEEKKEEEKKEVNKDGTDNENKEETFEPLSSGAKSLCLPYQQPEGIEGKKCIGCEKEAKIWCLFGRSY